MVLEVMWFLMPRGNLWKAFQSPKILGTTCWMQGCHFFFFITFITLYIVEELGNFDYRISYMNPMIINID